MDEQKTIVSGELEPWSLFIYAMKAPMTRDRYQTRVAKFFKFIGIDGITIDEKARNFVTKTKNDTNWAFNSIIRFTYFQKERVDRKEISGATVRNYIKSIKLFCEMADVPIQWKKITRGLPKGRKYADDRIPTLDEISSITITFIIIIISSCLIFARKSNCYMCAITRCLLLTSRNYIRKGKKLLAFGNQTPRTLTLMGFLFLHLQENTKMSGQRGVEKDLLNHASLKLKLE